eukprot:TRINITY_DN4380_c0_g1_i7.p1 TRINITY_DN4380_c0_g1~~TRINITY_DN4380_c0_g1_i7.p1  ORF type:complete len:519 (+),score=196.29 TRINITY_DN4380_c0_g1_i7:67-1623(+)
MTAEIHPKLPANLLRLSQVFVFEPPPGVKANLQHTFSAISSNRMDKAPVERARMYFLLAWFHAVVQERLRYAPLGWTKTFEFTEADQRVALDTLDYWIDTAANGKTNLSPEKIPWVALRTLLGQTVYGGRIDNDFDMRVLNSFLEQLFTEKSFDPEFPLVTSKDSLQLGFNLTVPDGTKKDHFVKWVEALPNVESPIWLGLPENAEVLLLTKKGQDVLRKLLKLQTIEEDSAESATSATSDGANAKRPAWMVNLQASIGLWLKNLPEKVQLMERTAESVKNPLFRFFEREMEIGAKLLKKIRLDLVELQGVCDQSIKLTNYTRGLIANLSKGTIPNEWKKYPVPQSLSTGAWIVDFAKRIKQLQDIRNSKDFGRSSIWMGGLFLPEAYITATRQAAAQANSWSVESLELQVEVLPMGTEPEADATSFIVRDVVLEGAAWRNNSLELTSEISQPLPPVKFIWRLKSTEETEKREDRIVLPIYLNETRAEFLVAVELTKPADISANVWYQKGVAMSVWSL